MNPDLHVVLGATGGVGAALTRELADRGHAVRAVSRTGGCPTHGVAVRAADVTRPDELSSAVAGATVVYHTAQPPYTTWPARFPAMTRAIADATARVGGKLVMVDNLYMYGAVDGGYGPGTPTGPMTESTPTRASGPKGRVRAAMAAELLERHRRGDLRVTIARLGDYYGPGARKSLVGEDVFARAIADRPLLWFGPAGHQHSFAYLPDVGGAVATLGADSRADGRVWHVPHAAPVTPADFVALVQQRAGARQRRRTIPVWALSAAARVQPMARELLELAYQLDRPFVVDHTAFDDTFGAGDPTPHSEAIDATLRWCRSR